jgi:hypothetical protein
MEYTLYFPSKYMVMVNPICIGGSAELYWNSDTTDTNEYYYLNEKNDRLSLASEKPETEHALIIKQNGIINELNKDIIFYVQYDIRNTGNNIDSLNLYKSANYFYNDNALPIYYYTPLIISNMQSNDFYEIFFDFAEPNNEINKNLKFTENFPYDINAYIVKESDMYNLRKIPDKNFVNNSNVNIKGVYDQGLRTGKIRISKTDVIKSKITENERPYLYFKIDKTEESKSSKKYNKLSIGTTPLISSSEIPISELSNQFGNLGKDEKERKYLLKTNKSYKYMNLQFSCLENNLLVKIEEREKDLILEESKYGKKFYSLEIKQNDDGETMHLIISKKDNTNNKEEEFMFQYTFSNEKSKSKYKIQNTTLDVTKRELGDYAIKLFPIENYDTYDLVYIIRFVYDEDGKVPSKPDISMKIKKQNVFEYHKPIVDKNKLYVEITDVKKNYSYIQIIAKIKDKENADYLSYDLFKFDYEKNEDKKIHTIKH